MAKGTREILKAAKLHFMPLINSHGFKRYRSSNTFVRRIENIYHFISFQGSQWGGSFYVYITAWVPELTTGIKDPSKMLKDGMDTIYIGGRLSPFGVGGSSNSWDYGSNESENIRTLERIGELIEVIAIPWFACMSTRENLVRGIVKDDREAVKKKILKEKKKVPEFGIASIEKEDKIISDLGELKPINDNSWWDIGDDSQFLECGGDILVDYMEKHNFSLKRAPALQFLREDGEYTSIMTLESASDGVHMNIRLYTWSEDVAHVLYDGYTAEEMEDDDDGYFWPVNGLFLGGMGLEKGNLAWLVAGEFAISKTMPVLLNAIEKWAFPWYKQVSYTEGFLNSLVPNQLPSERYDALVKRLKKQIKK